MKRFLYFIHAAVFAGFLFSACSTNETTQSDWLIDNHAFVSTFRVSEDGKDLILSNGLVSRVFRVTPNLATTGLYQLSTGQNHIRATRPEGSIVVDGTVFNIGGLSGQPVQNYLLPAWVDQMVADPNSFQYGGHTTQPLQKRFEWAKRAEWLSLDAAWPPAGMELILRFDAPAASPVKGMTAYVHYEIYDGLPLMCKWITLENQ
ncbi:MAG: hypothetical protein LBT35_04920, partial [Tannerella sp.]|nr:hypothetical protein [Tannerella sp.]